MTTESTATLTERVAHQLTDYQRYIEIKTNAGLLDVAIFGEALARDLAKIAFGYTDLINLNLDKSFPAIDLASAAASCAVQVTLSADSKKIAETQRKFFGKGLHKTYARLKFITLKKKPTSYRSEKIVREHDGFTFDPKKDVFDLGDLYRRIVLDGQRGRLEEFGRRLDAEREGTLQKTATQPDLQRSHSTEVTLPALHLRRLFNAHRVLATDAIEGMRQFGVTREIYADDLKLSNAVGRSLIDHVATAFSVSQFWIDGTDDHIYSGGPGAELSTGWRRSLLGAYELVDRLASEGQTLTLFVPHGATLRELDDTSDVIDRRESGYRRFFLVAQKKNAFLAERYRIVVADHLSYRPCRDGLFLLFLAAELRRLVTQQQVYIDLWETSEELVESCSIGSGFIVELKGAGGPFRNHTDFIFYNPSERCLRATEDVPPRLASRLQQELSEFGARGPVRLPKTITF